MEEEDNRKKTNVDEAANKKKYAVMFGYCGTGYHGSQTNKNTDTIDDDLIDGLHKANCISDRNYEDENRFVKNGWTRAARTDKGVHAAGNVINCKLAVIAGKEGETVDRINSCLPCGIRVFKILRTTKNFNSKNFCDRRQYEYVLPVNALSPYSANIPVKSVSEDISTEWDVYVENEKYLREKAVDSLVDNPFEDKPDNHQRVKSLSIAQNILDIADSFCRYTPDIQDSNFGGTIAKTEWPSYLSVALQRVRACMSLFIGTHNFHNYTVGKTAVDASAQRHLINITVSDPVRINSDMYIRICLEGQSFMLHQIRKMIGIAVEVARGRCCLHDVYCSLSRGDMVTPMAPSTGLFLDKPIFGEYNKKIKSDPAKVIDFDDPLIAVRRCEFKRCSIYEHIDEQIRTENAFNAWIASNDSYNNSYKVVYPSKDDVKKMEDEAKELNKQKRAEKDEKWEKKRKIEGF